MAWWTLGTTPVRPYGEQRLLDSLTAHRTESVEAIVNAALAEAESFGGEPIDDRTLLVMRI